MNKFLTYLAVPYSHKDPQIREYRFKEANRAAGKLINDGHYVFSPISHTHPIAMISELPKGWEYWKTFDEIYLNSSHTLIVLTLDGWKESIGVTAEINLAKELSLIIYYMTETHDFKECA